MPVPDISKLKATLLTSGISQKNQALHQVIWSLIEFCQAGFQATDAVISGGSGGSGGITSKTYITADNELASLPNSRQAIAGLDISLDTATPGQIIINSTGGPNSGYWTVLTDGDPDETDLIFADGEAIAVWVPL